MKGWGWTRPIEVRDLTKRSEGLANEGFGDGLAQDLLMNARGWGPCWPKALSINGEGLGWPGLANRSEGSGGLGLPGTVQPVADTAHRGLARKIPGVKS